MQEEINDFIEALCSLVTEELRRQPELIYSQEAIRIADARNHIFYKMDCAVTDESEDIYALRDLCYTDEDMNTMPDRQRMRHIARNYWDI